jgi:hypothetical protein
MSIQLYETCPYIFSRGQYRGEYCNQNVEAGQIYCVMCSKRKLCDHKITCYDTTSYLDGRTNFVFTHHDGTITISGVATSKGLIWLNETELQFAETRGWFVEDGSNIKEPEINYAL